MTTFPGEGFQKAARQECCSHRSTHECPRRTFKFNVRGSRRRVARDHPRVRNPLPQGVLQIPSQTALTDSPYRVNSPANKWNFAPLAGERVSAKVSVLVVGSPALTRIVKHLFASGRDFEVVGSLKGLKSLAPQAERLLPRLIVDVVKPLSIGVGTAVRTIKRSSPSSKLILLCPIREFVSSGRHFGADACLDPENLIAQLLPRAAALSASSRHS